MTVLIRDGVTIDVPDEVVAYYVDQGFRHPGQAPDQAPALQKPRARKKTSSVEDQADTDEEPTATSADEA